VEYGVMHILITGAGGMIGRKLAERFVADRALGGTPMDKLTEGGAEKQQVA
jgi:nucleoside-diphosphate-sugar epimerase